MIPLNTFVSLGRYLVMIRLAKSDPTENFHKWQMHSSLLFDAVVRLVGNSTRHHKPPMSFRLKAFRDFHFCTYLKRNYFSKQYII